MNVYDVASVLSSCLPSQFFDSLDVCLEKDGEKKIRTENLAVEEGGQLKRSEV